MKTISYLKQIMVQEQYDVLVLGGGPAGIMAAIAAAREGANTAIVEQYGFFGGMATAGLVAPISVFRYNDELTVGGLPWDFVQRMVDEGGAKIEYPLGNISFNPECYKLVAQRMLKEAGVTMYLHTRLVDCSQQEGVITAAILQNKGGLFALEAKIFIDCSGDGDMAAYAGVPMQPKEEELQPASTYFCITGVDTSNLPRIHHSQQGINYHMEDLRDILLEARKTENVPEFGGPWMCYMMSDDTVLVNMTRRKINIFDGKAVAEAECQLREDAFQLVEVLKKHVPAFANACLIETAAQAGVRETRHMQGVHLLTGEEYLNAVHFEDAVARCSHPVDIHASKGHKQRCEFLKEAAYIPYRSLIAEKFPNLLVACRAFSADRIAFASARVQAGMMGIGQAAGVAAAQCAKTGSSVQDVDIHEMRKTLIEWGAII